MPNLLTRTPMSEPQEDAELYVVWDRKDFRMTLATLISLVTKNRLGLENADNTSDIDKPVSKPTSDALDLKADKATTPTIEAFDALAAQLQDYVTIDQLNGAVDAAIEGLNKYSTIEQTAQAIEIAVGPIMDAFSSLEAAVRLQVQNLSDEVAKLAANTLVQISAVQAEIASFEARLADKADRVHRHAVDDIDGLKEYIESLISGFESAIIIGPNDW